MAAEQSGCCTHSLAMDIPFWHFFGFVCCCCLFAGSLACTIRFYDPARHCIDMHIHSRLRFRYNVSSNRDRVDMCIYYRFFSFFFTPVILFHTGYDWIEMVCTCRLEIGVVAVRLGQPAAATAIAAPSPATCASVHYRDPFFFWVQATVLCQCCNCRAA